MQKAGWTEGKGLGRTEQGDTSHVKVTRKDDVLGIGYTAQVNNTWSEQSVGFADVLARVQAAKAAKAAAKTGASESEDEEAAVKTGSSGPVAGKHSVAYAKRRRLKTGALTSDEGRDEVLGTNSAATAALRRQREADEEEEKRFMGAVGLESHLASPTLRRMMQRTVAHEPKRNQKVDENGEVEFVTITVPEPKPPKAAGTPFTSSGRKDEADE
jgi:Pin2-interacting protein X1